MATRKQRALKLARRRSAQASHRGIRIEDNGDSRIQVPTGPTPTPGFRRTNPYEHGEELRRREQVVSFCARIGFEPTDEQIKMMSDLLKQGRLTEQAIERLANPLHRIQLDHDASLYGFSAVDGKTGERVDPRALLPHRPKITRVHSDEIELMSETNWQASEAVNSEGFVKIEVMTHEELEQDAWDQAAYEQRMGWPTPAQWAELETTAKAKKKGARGYVRVLEEAGFVLGKNEDPKDRKSWVKT